MEIDISKIQLYKGVKDTTGSVITIDDAVEYIQSDKLKRAISDIRNCHDDEKKSYLKSLLPAVTWSGTFSKRQAKHISTYSRVMCLDIDHLPADKFESTRQLLSKSKYCFILFTSPSGSGLKMLVFTDCKDEKNHKDYFLALEAHYAQYGIIIDKSGKDVSRLCFLSHDPQIFVNDNFETFKLPVPEKKIAEKKLTGTQQKQLEQTGEDLYSVQAFTEKVMQYTEGNRNNFIHLFACNANRKGFDLSDVLSFSQLTFTDLPASEIKTTVTSAYQLNANEHGKFKKQSRSALGKAPKKSDLQERLPQRGQNKQPSAEPKPFWRKYKIKKGKGEDAYEKEIIELNRVDFSDFLFANGFHLLSTGKTGYQLCQSGNGVIKPVEPHHVKQYVLNWCRQRSHRDVEEMLRKGQKQYFAANELDALQYKDIDVKKDTKEESYFYFKNCWVSVSEDSITTHDYSELDQYIWDGNKIDRDFNIEKQNNRNAAGNIDPAAMTSEFAKFLFYFSYNPKCPDEQDFEPDTIDERFYSIANAYGFLLDGYKHPAHRKGIFAVDHKIGEKGEQNGRTGKSILPKAASYMKVVAAINGKSFKADYQFKYEQITRDTQIVNFNDMQRNFDVEQIFEVIADDYSVIRRANGYVDFTYYDSPKVYYSTNFTPSGEGASYSGRMHVIEASDYFSDSHSPYDEFKHSLFTDWDDAEWNRFFNFSLQCVKSFKRDGLVKYPKSNFDMRKLVNSVVPEFIDFMDTDCPRNTRIEKVALLEKFNVIYSNLYSQKLKPHTFHKWVKAYAKNRQLQYNPHRNGSFDKSNGKEYYVLANAEYKPEMLHQNDNDLFNSKQ